MWTKAKPPIWKSSGLEIKALHHRTALRHVTRPWVKVQSIDLSCGSVDVVHGAGILKDARNILQVISQIGCLCVSVRPFAYKWYQFHFKGVHIYQRTWERERERESNKWFLRPTWPPCFSKKFPTTTLDSQQFDETNPPSTPEKILKNGPQEGSGKGESFNHHPLGCALAGHVNLWNETQHLSNPFNFIPNKHPIHNYPYPSIQIQKNKKNASPRIFTPYQSIWNTQLLQDHLHRSIHIT